MTEAESAHTATVTGMVVDASAGSIAGAKLKLSRGGSKAELEAVSGEDGEFVFKDVPYGPFEIVVSAPGFSERVVPGSVAPGQDSPLPPIALAIATVRSDVDVRLSRVELAQEQIEDQEKQRVLGVIPNFYVSYLPNAVPLNSAQKFQMAWRTGIDPVTFGVSAIIAGVQQAQNNFGSFGQGSSGYAKRFAASYATFFTGTVISSAILPSVFKQDPRYFYKGSGSVGSRFLYAISRAIIVKGDNGHWQPAYSDLLGSLASSGISNLYYPAKDRDGASLTFQNLFIGIGSDAAANLFQEFLVRKLTPHANLKIASQPQP